MSADAGIITADTFKSICTGIVLHQSSGRRQENSALFVFTQVEDLSQFLTDSVTAVVFAPGTYINSIYDRSRTTCDFSVFITNNLLCFDERHGRPLIAK